MDQELWKLKRLIERLESFKGDHTSMITLLIRPDTKVSDSVALVNHEVCTAENIKSRMNRQSVIGALTSISARLKLYHVIPRNGLAVFCGTDETGKRWLVDIEPPKPVDRSTYLCDSTFHTEQLRSMLQADNTYGLVVLGGDNMLFATLSGTSKIIKENSSIDLPKKHNKGGQSNVRFSRLREEAIHNYIRKIGERFTHHFFLNDNVTPSVQGIIVGGPADIKHQLLDSEFIRPELKRIVLGVVDTAYTGENGLSQLITSSQSLIRDSRLLHEMKMLQSFFDLIAKDSQKIVYGKKQTLECFMSGVIDTLIVHDEYKLPMSDIPPSGSSSINLEDVSDGMEWLISHAASINTNVVIVTNNTSEGSQFVNGFGGLGGILRYEMCIDDMNLEGSENYDPLDEDDDVFFND